VSRPLFLTGMMGCGKSTVGRLLASRRRVQFVDLDARVERLFGVAIADLIAGGEPAFRAAERAALVSLVAEPGFVASGAVVATGGGAVIDPENRTLMRGAGSVIHLEVDLEITIERLVADEAARPGSRPLLRAGGAEPGLAAAALRTRLQKLATNRAAAYADCDVVVCGVGEVVSVAERVDVAVDALKSHATPAAAAPTNSEAV